LFENSFGLINHNRDEDTAMVYAINTDI
jgi:hypothetical protein